MLGQWEVFDTLGKKIGENTLRKEEGNCLFIEKWVSAQGATGTSMNYWNGSDSTWNQVWVDASGNSLILKGKLLENRMVLRSDPYQTQQGNTVLNQITWTPKTNGNVEQKWEVIDANGVVSSLAFLGIYKRSGTPIKGQN